MQIKIFCISTIILLLLGTIVATAGCLKQSDKEQPYYDILSTPSPDEYNIERTISDGAQRQTIAFDALAFLTGNGLHQLNI